MLEENSAAPPPTGGLAAAAEARGRRIRRRRAAAGTVAAAALAALGFTAVPALLPEEGSRDVVAAASGGPTDAANRPDVDLSLLEELKNDEYPAALVHPVPHLRLAEPGEDGGPAMRTGRIGGRTDYLLVTGLHALGITGTVEGFSTAPDPSGSDGGNGSRLVLMKVRLDSQLDDSPEFRRRGLREGETVELSIGTARAGADPAGLLNRAIPAGVRVLAFEVGSPQLAGYSESAGPRLVQGVVLEDSDGRPVGASYDERFASDPMAPPPAPLWKKANTFDEVLKLVRKVVLDCPLVNVFGTHEFGPEEKKLLSQDAGEPAPYRCLSISLPSDTPAPRAPRDVPSPRPTSTSAPAPTPSAPEPSPAAP